MFDSVIIGGGLAGCSAAITLAKQNRRVLLLEAGRYPRPKVCGEFLSPECVALFKNLGFSERLQALHPVMIDSLRITAPDGREWCSRLPAPAVGVSRFALDEALSQHASSLGVSVQEETRVTAVEGTLREGFTLTAQTSHGLQTFQAASIIAAHGRRSPLDRALNRLPPKNETMYVGLKQHFWGPAIPHRIDLHVFEGGYCGMSQVEDGTTNVCLLVRQDLFQRIAGGPEGGTAAFIAWMGQQNAYLQRWLAQAVPVYPDWLSIAQVSLRPKTPLEGDILIAGDAGGMIAPLAGDGMAMALHGGILAAQALTGYFTHKHDAQTMRRLYAHQWRRTFVPRLTLGRLLQAVMLRPRWLSQGLRLLNTVPSLGQWLVKHTRDLDLLEARQ